MKSLFLSLLLLFATMSYAVTPQSIIGGDIDITDGKCVTYWKTLIVSTPSNAFPSVYAQSSNTIYIAYIRSGDNLIEIIKTTDGGTSWSSTVISSAAGDSHSEVALDSPDGGKTLYVLYQSYISATSTYDIILAKSLDGGSTWTESILDTSTQYYWGSALNVPKSTNKIFILFNKFPSPSLKLIHSTDAGNTFSTPVTVYTGSSQTIKEHGIASIDGDTLYIPFLPVSNNCISGSGTMCIAKSVDGGVTFTYISLGLTTWAMNNVQCYLANNSLLYFIGDSYWLMFNKYDGTFTQTKITTDSPLQADIAGYGNSNIYISRRANVSPYVLDYIESLDGGTSFTHTTLDPNSSSSTSIFALSDKSIFITYIQPPNLKLAYTKCGI